MEKKYVEQPAFETNEFKVGDNVRVYTKLDGISDLKVVHVNGDYIRIHGYDTVPSVHFKQCRLLKEVVPREFYLDPRRHQRTVVNEYKSWYNRTEIYYPSSDQPLPGYIKVREVLDDE